VTLRQSTGLPRSSDYVVIEKYVECGTAICSDFGKVTILHPKPYEFGETLLVSCTLERRVRTIKNGKIANLRNITFAREPRRICVV
jgi:hypothetical protein